MAVTKVKQVRLAYRGRTFHFVAYEGRPANAKRNQAAVAPAWFLMGPGKRWRVMRRIEGRTEPEIEERLIAWLEDHAFA